MLCVCRDLERERGDQLALTDPRSSGAGVRGEPRVLTHPGGTRTEVEQMGQRKGPAGVRAAAEPCTLYLKLFFWEKV